MKKIAIKNLSESFDYFNAARFAEAVIIEAKLESAKPEVKAKIMETIMGMLAERTINVIVDRFGDREMFLLKKLSEDHPGLDRIDIVSIICPSIPGLDKLLAKTADDLFQELVSDAERLRG